MDKDEEFQLEVVERLTRLETKIDYANGTLKKACADITVLQKRADTGDIQWSVIKKIFTLLVAAISVSGTLLGIVMRIMGMI